MLRDCAHLVVFDMQASCDLHVLHLTWREAGIIMTGGNHIENICVLFFNIRNQRFWFLFFFSSSLATGPMKPSPYDSSVVHFSDSGAQSYLAALLWHFIKHIQTSKELQE